MRARSGTVADEEQHRPRRSGRGSDELLERRGSRGSCRPSRSRPCRRGRGAPEPRAPSGGGVKRSRSTPVGVISTRSGGTPSRSTSSATTSVPHATTVAAAQCGLLAASLEPGRPSRPLHAPLLRLPHVQRGHEQRPTERRACEQARHRRCGRARGAATRTPRARRRRSTVHGHRHGTGAPVPTRAHL